MKTRFGVCLTYIVLILVIVTGFFFGQDFYFKTNATVLKKTNKVETADYIYFSKKNFPIAFGLQDFDSWEHFMDETIYTIKAFKTYTIKSKDQKGLDKIDYLEKQLKTKICDYDDMPIDEYSGFNVIKESYNKLYCLDYDAN